MSTDNTFEAFAGIPRLFRGCTITEKIDGTNAQIVVTGDGQVLAGSRSRYITPEADNFGFAAWVKAHEDELRQLGEGRHFGEWWGCGIQRGYGLTEKRFSLFNVSRWGVGFNPQGQDPRVPPKARVVPIMYEGPFSTTTAWDMVSMLCKEGSAAAPGFMNPEGIVVFHSAGQALFKATIGGDGHKGRP